MSDEPWKQAVDDALSSGEAPAAPDRPSWAQAVDDAVAPPVTAGQSPPSGAPVRITVRPQGVPPQPGEDDTSGDTLRDIGAGLAGGFGRGVAGLAGTLGSINQMVGAGRSYLGIPSTRDLLVKGGLPADKVDTAFKIGGILGGPALAPFTGAYNSDDFQKGIENVTGKFYEPHTVPGQYASTLASFVPAAATGGGSATARAVNTVVPALASEAAGQYTKNTPYEGPARFVAGLGGGVLGAKGITPFAPARPAWQAATNVLEREGVPLSAGDRTGSMPLRWLESVARDMPFSAPAAARQQEAQSAAVSRYLTGQAFDPAELAARGIPANELLPSHDVMAAGRQSLSDEYNRLAGNNVLRSDPQLHRDLTVPQQWYANRALEPQPGANMLERMHNRIVDELVAGQGQMPGTTYQSFRSTLTQASKDAYSSNNSNLGAALKAMRNGLDRAMERGLSPEDAAAWQLNNQRYANMKGLTQAVAKAGENMTPAGIAASVRSGRAEQYARNAGPLDEFSHAAATVLKPLAQSGTAPRTAYQNLFSPSSVSSGVVGGALGSLFGPLGLALGIAAPHVASRLVISAPVQRYLGNRVLPQNMRDIITQATMQQAASQPGTLERNAAAREAYRKQFAADRTRQGYR